MTNINLLPWRAQRRYQAQKNMILVFWFLFLFSFVIILVVYHFIHRQFQRQGLLNQYLIQELRFNKQTLATLRTVNALKKQCLDRIMIIKQIQIERTLILYIVSKIVSVLPNEVYIYKIIRNKNKLAIIGYADSNIPILGFMNAIQLIPSIKLAHLDSIKTIHTKIHKNEARFKLSIAIDPMALIGTI